MIERHYLPVVTIGHSLHSKEKFLQLLAAQQIDIVLDVRSSPFSRRAPHFARPEMKRWLATAGIGYSYGGRALGCRPQDPSLYEGGRADYERMARTSVFVTGLRRIVTAAESKRIALLCAEGDPIECHRFLLIGRALANAIDVFHVLPNGALEKHRQTEERLLAAVGLSQSEFFAEKSDALETAYRAQSSRVAFMTPSRGSDWTGERPY